MQVGLLLLQSIRTDILNDSRSGVIQIRERQHVRPAFQAVMCGREKWHIVDVGAQIPGLFGDKEFGRLLTISPMVRHGACSLLSTR